MDESPALPHQICHTGCPDDSKSLAAFAQSGLVLVRANMDPSGHNSIKKFLEIVENAVTNNDAVMKNEASPMQQCKIIPAKS